MFWHIFIYRLRCIARDVSTLFWSAAFPILLATLFGMAFSNLSANETFRQIPVAVVDNDAYQSDEAFQTALDATMGEERMFTITLCDEQEAKRLLDSKSVTGVLTMSDSGDLSVTVSDTGIYQTIIKSFADSYVQLKSAYTAIAMKNPAAFALLMQEEFEQAEYVTDVPLGASVPDNTVVYYFALIAMACMYGSFQGMTSVTSVQANQSDIAARNNLVPVHKLKLFGASLTATLFVQLISVLLLIVYLALVIGIQFGDRLGYILLACTAGTTLGVSFGAMVGALLKRREGIKVAILIGISMVSTFLAGLMYVDMKYIIAKNVPLLSYLNPANLVADAFYALYYYDTLDRFFLNIGLLFGFSGVFFLIVFVVMRRQKYASL